MVRQDEIFHERLAEQANHFVLDEQDKAFLLRACRLALESYFSGSRLRPTDFADVPNSIASRDPKVYVSLHCDGRVRGCRSAQAGDMLASALRSTVKAIREERLGGRLKRQELGRTYIDITVPLEPERVDQRNGDLSRQIELGVHSVSIEGAGGRAFFKSSVPVDKGYSLTRTLTRLSRKAGLEPRAYKTDDVTIHRHPTIQFAEEFVDRFTDPRVRDLYRGAPLIWMDDVNRGSLERSLRLAAEYLKRHTTKRGRLTYHYDLATGERTFSNAKVAVLRRAASTFAMVELAGRLNDRALRRAAMRSVDYLLAMHFRVEPDLGFGYLTVRDTANVGLAGFVLATLTALDDPDFHPAERDALAEFILAMEDREGGFLRPMYLPRPSDATDSKHHYYPGEAMMGLMALYERTGDSRYRDLLVRVFPFYRALFRTSDRWLNMAAWMSKPYAALFAATGEREYADFVFEINDRVVERQHGLEEVHPDVVGGFSRSGKSGSSAVFLESVAEGSRAARLVGDAERTERYGAALALGMRFMLQSQHTPAALSQHPHRGLAVGGFRTGFFDASVRIDGVQHCSCAILGGLRQLDLAY